MFVCLLTDAYYQRAMQAELWWDFEHMSVPRDRSTPSLKYWQASSEQNLGSRTVRACRRDVQTVTGDLAKTACDAT